MRVLLVEDERQMARHISEGLKENGYVVDLAENGPEAIWLGENHTYDLMVIDVMLPERDGISVVRHFRRKGITSPVIFCSARGEVEDRVQGLDAGADDYLVKPFSIAELLARLRALVRRQRPELTNVLRVGDLELDLVARACRRGPRPIELTNREFALLEFLMLASPHPVTKTAIVERVWDQYFDSGTNVVSVYINYLRGKIEADPEPALIHTVRGVGYALYAETP